MFIVKLTTTLGTIRFLDVYGFLTPDKKEAAKFDTEAKASEYATKLNWGLFDVVKL